MNISDINSYYAYLTSSWSVSGTSSTQNTAAELLSALSGNSTSVGSTSGDSAELSLTSLMMASGMQPATAGGPPDDSFKELVDKVAGGTATDDDMEQFIAQLKDMAAKAQDRTGNEPPPFTADPDMEALMDKAVDGTATRDDLKSIATKLQEMGPGGRGGHQGNGLKELVDKAANGTATDDELEELLTKLKKMAEERQSRLANGQTSTSADSEMESLMAKVLDGTATNDDVKAIAAKMQEKDDQRATRSDTIYVNSENAYSLPRKY